MRPVELAWVYSQLKRSRQSTTKRCAEAVVARCRLRPFRCSRRMARTFQQKCQDRERPCGPFREPQACVEDRKGLNDERPLQAVGNGPAVSYPWDLGVAVLAGRAARAVPLCGL